MGCPIHGHPAMACEHCEAVYARALTAARAEGYAEAVDRATKVLREEVADLVTKAELALECYRASGYAACQADVVAWLRARADGLRSHTYGQDDERTVLERVVDGIEDACHVGAAKKGGV